MATVQDGDIEIWVCPHGYPYDVIEFSVGGREPILKVCGSHGEPFHKRCPNRDCPDPIYHPSDFDQNFHTPCGEKIPWAEARRASAQIDYEPFNSTLLGRNAPELTPQERQDLIIPPSERLPLPRVRATQAHDNVYTIESSNLNRYLFGASAAIDKPPRQAVRAVLKFLRDRGEAVGRGADKGLEDAVTLLVKTVIIVGVITALGVCGIRLALGT